MRLIAFSHNGKPALGMRIGQELVNLTAEGQPATLDELLRGGEQAMAAAKRVGEASKNLCSRHPRRLPSA